jgi:hypothetical protein
MCGLANWGLDTQFCAENRVWPERIDLWSSTLRLLAGMFGFSIQSREVSIGVLQHLVLIAVAELAGKGAVFGTALAVGVQSVIFDCALAHSFISSSRGGVGHSILPGPGVKDLIVASGRVGWPSNRASVSVWLGERVNLRCQRHGGGVVCLLAK